VANLTNSMNGTWKWNTNSFNFFNTCRLQLMFLFVNVYKKGEWNLEKVSQHLKTWHWQCSHVEAKHIKTWMCTLWWDINTKNLKFSKHLYQKARKTPIWNIFNVVIYDLELPCFQVTIWWPKWLVLERSLKFLHKNNI